MVITARQRETGRVDILQISFLRVIGMVFIFFSIQYWMRLTGVYPGAEFSFDTMSEHWRLASSVLAVLLPATALGLWGGYRWGVVLWLVAAIMELTMHVAMTGQFGRSDMRVAFHLIGLLAVAGFWLSKFIVANKK